MEIESGKEKRETAQNGTTLLAMYVSTRKNREKKKCKQTVKHTPKKKKSTQEYSRKQWPRLPLWRFLRTEAYLRIILSPRHTYRREEKKDELRE